VVALYPRSVNDTLSTMERIGEVLGTEASTEASRLVDELQARVNAVLEKTNDLPDEERKKVFLVLASGGQTAGNRTISNELIEMAGGRNIFGDKERYYKPNKEEVLKREPDVIVVENSPLGDNKYFNDLYGDTEIVNPDQIYRIDSGMLTASPRLVEALEQLAKWLHPELFP